MNKTLRNAAVLTGAIPLLAAPSLFAANHREAPITALDHKADITDVYAFVSYDGEQTTGETPESVTMIMCVDPLLAPANGPNYFPFDDDILYELKVDNNNDAIADVTLQFRFNTEQRLPNVFTTVAGVGAEGAVAPDNAPDNLNGESTAGAGVVPPRIDSFASAGLGQRQSYTITMVSGNSSSDVTGEGPLYAVPCNAGPRTMDYGALFDAATYTGLTGGISSFAGTVDDPFWIDLGGTFDTVNLSPDTGPAPGVMSAENDALDGNVAPDNVAGFAVNAIAVQVPITMLTSTGQVEAADSVDATIGIWATTSRNRVTVRRSPLDARSTGNWRQVQRMGNPLVNEVLIGTDSKNRFSMDEPVNDSQFAAFVLDPVLARVANALYGGILAIPPVGTTGRVDLLPLVTYAPPIAAPGTPGGPIADLLRLNTGAPATPPAAQNRLGALAGDNGFPNGRRLVDDVTDIALRVVVGGVLVADKDSFAEPGYQPGINDMIGDGVNVNDVPYRNSFPYLAHCPSGNPDPQGAN